VEGDTATTVINGMIMKPRGVKLKSSVEPVAKKLRFSKIDQVNAHPGHHLFQGQSWQTAAHSVELHRRNAIILAQLQAPEHMREKAKLCKID
jgi:hypothetical protein